MFKESEIKAYKSIKAPESLKEKVLGCNTAVKKTKNTVYKQITVLAACLVLVFSIGFAGIKTTVPSIYVGNAEISGDTVYVLQGDISLASSRSANVDNRIVKIDSVLNTTVTIENGSFDVISQNTGNSVFSGKEYSAKGKVTILINVNKGEKAVLTVSNPVYIEKITFVAE